MKKILLHFCILVGLLIWAVVAVAAVVIHLSLSLFLFCLFLLVSIRYFDSIYEKSRKNAMNRKKITKDFKNHTLGVQDE